MTLGSRCLLHKNKLQAFEEWLVKNGYELQTPKGDFEVLRAKKDKDTVIIFTKLGAKGHCSVQGKDLKLVRRFIKEMKK